MTFNCSLVEMMRIQAARELAGGGAAFVGHGLPVLATTVARLHHQVLAKEADLEGVAPESTCPHHPSPTELREPLHGGRRPAALA